jgi:hypothetical protein
MFLLILASVLLVLVGCADKKVVPKPENFLTLADLSGRVTLKEDSPGVRVIRIKAKAFIKRNDIRAAKTKAIEIASARAVDAMVRELLARINKNIRLDIFSSYFKKLRTQKLFINTDLLI